jgi:GTPase SAR1 family protein
MRVLVFGKSGSGKRTFARQYPKLKFGRNVLCIAFAPDGQSLVAWY